MTLSTEQFDKASNHAYECRCDLCKQWWAEVGPEDDDDDIEVDTCLGCGRAIASATIEIVDGHVVQLCHRCKGGEPPPHEF